MREQITHNPEANEAVVDELMKRVDMRAIAVRHGSFNMDKPSLNSDEYKNSKDVIGHLKPEAYEDTKAFGSELAASILSDGKETIFYVVGSPTNWVNEAEGIEYPDSSRTMDTATALAEGLNGYIQDNDLSDLATVHEWKAGGVRPEKRIRDAGYDAVLDLKPAGIVRGMTQGLADEMGIDSKDLWVQGHPILDNAITNARESIDGADPRNSRETADEAGSALTLAERSMRIRLANATEEERERILNARHVIVGGTHGLVMRASALFGGSDQDYATKNYGALGMLEMTFDPAIEAENDHSFAHWRKTSE